MPQSRRLAKFIISSFRWQQKLLRGHMEPDNVRPPARLGVPLARCTRRPRGRKRSGKHTVNDNKREKGE